jgi:type III pantothenate kinase
MLLAIDVGNSNIVFGVHDGTTWKNQWRMQTVAAKMPDEYGVFFRDLLREEGIDKAAIGTSIVSSVVPVLTGKMFEVARGLNGIDPIIVGPGIKTGLKIRTDNPSEVGSDLVCNAVAAYQRTGGNTIIVDFGTALTFTAVSKPGELVGVAIAPGIQAAAEALSQGTAQLPQVGLDAPSSVLGKNTIHSIQSGILYGYAGLVDRLIDIMRAELGGEATVIATGGRAEIISPLTDKFTMIEPWLVLEGLRIIAEKNRVPGSRPVPHDV